MANKSIAAPAEGSPSPHLPLFDRATNVILPNNEDPRDFLRHLEAGRAVVAMVYSDMVNMATGATMDDEKVVHPGRSAHGVGFGNITSPWFVPDRSKVLSYPVAFKPFSDPADAMNEVRGYMTLREQGIETFRPIGAFPSEHEDYVVVVTAKRNDLRSLDRDKWVAKRDVKDAASFEISQRNNKTIVAIAELMAYIHTRGIYHPDGQIKNFAKTPSGKVGIIDTENLEVTELGQVDAGQRAWRDFQKLIKSLIYPEPISEDGDDGNIFGVGMWSGLSDELVKINIEQYLIEPYLEKLTEQYDGADEDRETQIDQLGSLVYYYQIDDEWLSQVIAKGKHRSRVNGQQKLAA